MGIIGDIMYWNLYNINSNNLYDVVENDELIQHCIKIELSMGNIGNIEKSDWNSKRDDDFNLNCCHTNTIYCMITS